MNDLIQKLQTVEEEIATEKGPLNLFAVMEREDLFNRWDLLIAASWARFDEKTLNYVSDRLKRHLEPEEMTLLARIVILDATEDPVRAITESYDVEHGPIQFTEAARFGLPVNHGYIFTSRPAA